MFNGDCKLKGCENKAKGKYKLIVPWAYAYGGGEVIYDYYCSEECMEKGKKDR